MSENDYSAQSEYDVNAQYIEYTDSNVYADQGGCFWVPGGRVCRDPWRGIECFYPQFGGPPSCRPLPGFGPGFGPGFRPGFRPGRPGFRPGRPGGRPGGERPERPEGPGGERPGGPGGERPERPESPGGGRPGRT